ncbi:nucleoside-binding protein [Mobilisporobacter senegalensis]|uniref:Nucleoside-binding protein n=1 Tax=Mobilisporobacter senegalensis TaxID=1329262 RepID=A0A3N1Y027_9FIRM|nr:BMP family ABC transporter substrate-binding protein [Mobilisporobacter senegalensis]ROR31878.1 nucleoside-binding protein [Mobilisporobacter senegalensis]
MKKRIIALLLAATMLVSLTACGTKKDAEKDTTEGTTTEETTGEDTTAEDTTEKVDFSVGMVTDTGGVNDQSFNQSAWEGLQNLQKNTGADISYLESTQETDYAPNLDKQVDEGKNLIWGIGFAMADAIITAAETNPDVNFAIIDNAYETTPANVTGVMFRAQEPSFVVGYIAGLTSKTGKVGFVGGMKGNIIDQFEYGYRAGVDYAAKELGKEITVDVQYAESFSDSAKGKAIATKMFSSDCDIVFHAAGGVGVGVIEAAKEAGKFAIGVDRDQAYLAPENVLTSALKLVNVAVELVSTEALNGTQIGGQTYNYGLAEDAVGIPEENPNMDPAIYDKAMEVEQLIKDGTIVPPYNADTYGK